MAEIYPGYGGGSGLFGDFVPTPTNALSLYNRPLAHRSSLLPIGTYDNGDGTESAGLAWPELFTSAKEAAEVPGRLLSGDQNQAMTEDDLHRTGLNAAGLMMGGGLLAPRPANALAMSGGRIAEEGAAGAALDMSTQHPGFDVWHGSPHDFDKFSLDHIGNGEGAQAYGHGLYFAESKDVATGYRDTLSNSRGLAPHPPPAATGNTLRDQLNALQSLQASAADGAFGLDSPGYLYQSRINADPEHFLDWDKPLSQQSENVRDVFSRVQQAPDIPGQLGYYRLAGDLTGTKSISSPEVATKLREAGIPGIRYLDGGSRSAGEGSRNYVVFDDRLIDTLHKWRGDQQLYSTGFPLPNDNQSR